MKRSEYDKNNKLRNFMTLEEEKEYYNEVCARVIANPRYYLDNLDDLYVFHVSFINYFPIDEYNPNQYTDIKSKPL